MIKERISKLNPGPVNRKMPIMIGGRGEKVTLRLVAEHADMYNTFGPPEHFRQKLDVLEEWCAKVGRNPAEIEKTVCLNFDEVDNVDAYAAVGADHLIIMLGGPFDLKLLEKVKKHFA